jgi:hypothetical protein
MGTSFQYFNFWLTVEQIVIRLAHHRGWHVHLLAQAHDLCNAPPSEVRQTPVTNLAIAQQGFNGAQGFFKVQTVEVAVHVIDVQVVSLQAA